LWSKDPASEILENLQTLYAGIGMLSSKKFTDSGPESRSQGKRIHEREEGGPIIKDFS